MQIRPHLEQKSMFFFSSYIDCIHNKIHYSSKEFGIIHILFLKKSILPNKAVFIWLKHSKNCNIEKMLLSFQTAVFYLHIF